MSKARFFSFASALVVFASAASISLAAGPIAEPKLDTYVAAGAETYFAVSLSPNAPLPPAGPRDVVILFDTSASQTSLYREKALSALTALLAGLQRDDRVQLLAVDLDATPLTETFVPAQGPQIEQALVALNQRVPLGATDMPAVLRAAAARFGEDRKSTRLNSSHQI
jgi:uncharacterized protein with von Willebrand factor type A (vWA) domain